jgi:hypothetical protein
MKTIELTPRERLNGRLAELLWDSWVALGVAGQPSARAVPYVLDPEALLLATLRFGSVEPRLAGEVADWLAGCGEILSLQRLRNLQTGCKIAPADALAGLGGFMEGAGFPHWKALRGDAMARLFVSEGFKARGLARQPDPREPAAFLARLRRLFGVNARPEVLAWLLTHRSGHPAGIARETGWFSKSVQAILIDLEAGGFVTSEMRGKRREFSLNPRDRTLHPELGTALAWQTQGMLWTAFVHLDAMLGELETSAGRSAGARAVAVRSRLAPLRAALNQAGAADPFAGLAEEQGEELVTGFLAGVESMRQAVERRVFGNP